MTIRYRPAEDDGKEERVPVDTANMSEDETKAVQETQELPKKGK